MLRPTSESSSESDEEMGQQPIQEQHFSPECKYISIQQSNFNGRAVTFHARMCNCGSEYKSHHGNLQELNIGDDGVDIHVNPVCEWTQRSSGQPGVYLLTRVCACHQQQQIPHTHAAQNRVTHSFN